VVNVDIPAAFVVVTLAFVCPVDARFVVSVVMPLAFVCPVDARFVVSVEMLEAFAVVTLAFV
jgi:hypothetical protein